MTTPFPNVRPSGRCRRGRRVGGLATRAQGVKLARLRVRPLAVPVVERVERALLLAQHLAQLRDLLVLRPDLRFELVDALGVRGCRLCVRRAGNRQQQCVGKQDNGGDRSEEHTSELQSLMRISYAVFCLKKKKDNKSTNNIKKSTYTHICN